MRIMSFNLLKTSLFCSIIEIMVLSLFCFPVFAQPPADIDQRIRQLEQQMEGTTDLNKLMETYRETLQLMGGANRAAAGMTGTSTTPIRPAETPEEEVLRRREVINSQFRQMKSRMSLLPPGTEQPQLPEAVAVEGYLVVHGGEKELFSNEVRTDLFYTIKERFVGNLIIGHTYDPARGRFDGKKEYEIQSLSTKIDVSGMGGKKCVRRGPYSPSSCTGWAHFSGYEISGSERYPQFHSGVVSAETEEDGRITILAEAPAVIFLGDDGRTNLKAGCSRAAWTLSPSEFGQWLEQGELTLRRDIGRPMGPSPGCSHGSTMTLYLRVTGEPAEECQEMKSVELLVVSPKDKDRHVFSEHSNRLTLELEAKTVPAHYADFIEWTIPEIEGSRRTVVPASTLPAPKGRKFAVVYEGLPEDNNEFGRKTVKATLKVDSCRKEETREVRIFYPRDETNNPEGKHPNWFYYWKQTPAARPFGQNVRIGYHCTGIPHEKCSCRQRGVIGQFNPYYSGYKTINVCNLKTNTWIPKTFYAELPAVKRSKPSTLSERNYFSYTHIDTFAVAVMHEFTHFNHFHTFWPDGWKEHQDLDGDDLPDRLEPEMGFHPGKKQTHWAGVDLSDDEEFLTLEATYDYRTGTFDRYDWAKPGKNWPE